MRKSRFSEEQIIRMIREHEAGVKTADMTPRADLSRRAATRAKGDVRIRSCDRFLVRGENSLGGIAPAMKLKQAA